MDYHGRIMNIGASLETIERHLLARPDTAYRIGHRDARHAAAEIACEAQREIDETAKKLAVAKEIISALREIHGDQKAEIARLREALESAAAFKVGQDVSVEKCWRRDGSFLWAVRRFGDVLANDGDGWRYEPLASNRDDQFIARYRFATMDLAMTAARAALAPVVEVSGG